MVCASIFQKAIVYPRRRRGLNTTPAPGASSSAVEDWRSTRVHVVLSARCLFWNTYLQVLELILPLCEDWLLGKRLFSLKTLNTRGNQRRDLHGNFQEGRLIGNICKLRCWSGWWLGGRRGPCPPSPTTPWPPSLGPRRTGRMRYTLSTGEITVRNLGQVFIRQMMQREFWWCHGNHSWAVLLTKTDQKLSCSSHLQISRALLLFWIFEPDLKVVENKMQKVL